MTVMNVRRRRISGIPAIAIAAATALGLGTLSACSDTASAANTDKFDVVAAFYPLQYLAERSAGTTCTSPA